MVLKGETALLFCYGLDRFSEDLDFDAQNSNLNTLALIERFSKKYNYDCNVKKIQALFKELIFIMA